MWVIIGGELFAFSVLFTLFVYYRGQQPELFQQSHQTLSLRIGLANTIVLLTSSLIVALGVHRERQNHPSFTAYLRLTALFGFLFGFLKWAEYKVKIQEGITPLTNEFYTLYFVYTGIHLVHVTIGTIGLIVISQVCRNKPASPSRSNLVECGALFWHLVDLLWIMLFALFYLAGGAHAA